MANYRRVLVPGATYFLTLTLSRRRDNDLLIRHIGALRHAIKVVRRRHPFIINGWVVLPDHMHCVITLPAGDCDYASRIALIKSGFSRQVPRDEDVSASRKVRRERGVWQRRFWEHTIRDERDLQAHLDYTHYNPVKHGYVERVEEWPYSTFHRYVEQGQYPRDWCPEEASRGPATPRDMPP